MKDLRDSGAVHKNIHHGVKLLATVGAFPAPPCAYGMAALAHRGLSLSDRRKVWQLNRTRSMVLACWPQRQCSRIQRLLSRSVQERAPSQRSAVAASSAPAAKPFIRASEQRSFSDAGVAAAARAAAPAGQPGVSRRTSSSGGGWGVGHHRLLQQAWCASTLRGHESPKLCLSLMGPEREGCTPRVNDNPARCCPARGCCGHCHACRLMPGPVDASNSSAAAVTPLWRAGTASCISCPARQCTTASRVARCPIAAQGSGRWWTRAGLPRRGGCCRGPHGRRPSWMAALTSVAASRRRRRCRHQPARRQQHELSSAASSQHGG